MSNAIKNSDPHLLQSGAGTQIACVGIKLLTIAIPAVVVVATLCWSHVDIERAVTILVVGSSFVALVEDLLRGLVRVLRRAVERGSSIPGVQCPNSSQRKQKRSLAGVWRPLAVGRAGRREVWGPVVVVVVVIIVVGGSTW